MADHVRRTPRARRPGASGARPPLPTPRRLPHPLLRRRRRSSATHELSKASGAAAAGGELRAGGVNLGGAAGWLASLLQGPLHKLEPTSISTSVFAASLLLQCLGAPLLATTADIHGLHLEMYAGHVLLGVTACFGLAFGQPPLGVQATSSSTFAFQVCACY